MAMLEKRLGLLEQLSTEHIQNYKILTCQHDEPKQVIPSDGQNYIVVAFVKPKQRKPDHDEA